MDFDIRAISLHESIAFDARVELSKLAAKELTFRRGVQFSITFPDPLEQPKEVADLRKTFTALFKWARVYRYSEVERDTIHVLAPADDGDGGLLFYKVDFRQPPKPKHGRRPAVEIVGSAVMSYDECANWLVELAYSWAAEATNRDRAKGQLVLPHPAPISLGRMRMACVCPEILGAIQMPHRLAAIGQVFGAEIVHIAPRSYRDVAARLARALPLDGVLICRHFAPYVGEGVVPGSVCPDLIGFSDGDGAAEIEQEAIAWIDLCHEQVSKQKLQSSADNQQTLLALMLRGMMSHSKIGQFNHCPRATVLTAVRARRLNIPAAEVILDQNSEAYQDTKGSAVLFLWKEHHDGRQYFLNPKRVEDIRTLISSAFGGPVSQ